MNSRLTIDIQGIDDPSIASDVENTIRASLHQLAVPGAWRVAVGPSPVGGRWDFTLHGPGVKHKLSISVPAVLLASLIPVRLRESLGRVSGRRIPGALALAVGRENVRIS
jgi:hypothetical protein